MNDWRNRELVAKEVKVAAQAILDQCFSPNARALDPNRKKRIIPALLAIVAAWNGVAITAMMLVQFRLISFSLMNTLPPQWILYNHVRQHPSRYLQEYIQR